MKKEILFIIAAIIFSTFIVNAYSSIENENIKQCKIECKDNFKNSSAECKSIYNFCKENCTELTCKKECSTEKSRCIKKSIDSFKLCKSNCTPLQGCLNNTLRVNEKFTRGCEVCQCNKNNKIRCVKDNFSNQNVTIQKMPSW